MLEIFEIDTAMSQFSINDSSSGLPPSFLVSFFLQVLVTSDSEMIQIAVKPFTKDNRREQWGV